MPSDSDTQSSGVHPLSEGGRASTVSDELGRLTSQLCAEFPHAERISFEYHNDLHLHIDVRTLEEAHVIMAKLPGLCGGGFSDIAIGASPHHSFWQRVTAELDR